MSPLKRSNGLAARMGRWSAGHRKTAIFGWLAFVAVAFVVGNAVGTRNIDFATSGAGESGRAQQILDDAGFNLGEQREYVLVQSDRLTADDPAFRAAVADAVAAVSRFDAVEDVRSPLAEANAGQISPDRHAALVSFALEGDYDEAVAAIDPVLAAVEGVQAEHAGLLVAQSGGASVGKAFDETLGKDFERASLLAIPLTLAILFAAFGALVAAVVPVILALTAVAAAIGLVALPSQLVEMDQAAGHVILLIGLAVGVDYSLFYLRREREERRAGRGSRAAIEAAAATSGRAVLTAGLTVLIAMGGMLFTGDATFMSFGIATMTVVAVAMVGSLTVLPALLSALGDRVERGRLPLVSRLRPRRERRESRLWGAILDRVLRRPAVALVAAGGLLVALSVPVLDLHTQMTGFSSLPRTEGAMETFHRIQDTFPGGPIPAVVAVRADDVTAPDVQAAIADLKERALATGSMRNPISVDVSADGTVARVLVPFEGDGTDERSNAALAALRGDVLPATLGRLDGVEVAVAGMTAESHDFTQLTKDKAPIVFGFVLGFAFLLLLWAFRSIVIAVKAILLNLLSVGAAYGLIVATFQWGWGESLLRFESTGGVAAWLPIFLFVILFGLSMDYHVFILSRVREAYDRGLSTEDAVTHGIKTTAGTVTSAAAVMVAVFGVFATLSFVDMKMLGFGLAAAVLIDATIVRAVLLPAAMKLLGDANWYLPSWLSWLPRLEHERAPEAAPAPA